MPVCPYSRTNPPRKRPSLLPAMRLHVLWRSCGARQDAFPRGHTIPTGAVPGLARGLGHTAPTYLRRRPGSPSNGHRGPALSFGSIRQMLLATAARKDILRKEALRRRGALAPEARNLFSLWI